MAASGEDNVAGETSGSELALAGPVRVGEAGREFVVRPPGSKSLTNRALLLAGLCEGQSCLRGALVDADDAQRMILALRELGAGVEVQQTGEGATVWVQGVGGRWRNREDTTLFLNNAGTATRFLTASALLAERAVVVDGNARMRQRPIAELVESLRDCGARVTYVGQAGFVPVRVEPLADSTGLRVKMKTTQSSQFLSALLMLGPFLPMGVTLTLEGEITSESYVRMTTDLLALLGASVQTSLDMRVIRVGPGEETGRAGLRSFDLAIEPDASGATYFWGAAALAKGLTCRVSGVGPRSLQGDAQFAQLLERMGALRAASTREQEAEGDGRGEAWTSVTGTGIIKPILADLSDMPDAAMTLAAVASFARGTSILRGLRTLRAKETDRIAALRNELAKVGVRVVENVQDDPGTITITPPEDGVDCSPGCARVAFDTYDDHRMAMSMALLSVRRPNCVIRDPGCVGKTYKGFWREWSRLSEAPGESTTGAS
jgi:3-phosphoshikimate 1-carboxyvinyltransferase